MTRLVSPALLLALAAPAPAADVVLNPGRHPTPNALARLSADGKAVVTVGSDRCVRVWDADTGKSLAELWLPDHHGGVPNRAVVWLSPDGKTLATPYHTPEEPRGKFLLIPLAGPDRGTYRLVGGQDFDVEHVAFSPDGKRVAASGGKASVVVWDVASGKKVSEPKVDQNFRVTGAAFTPDGKQLSAFLVQTGYYEQNRSGVSTWDVETGKLLGERRVARDGVPRLQWSPDGKTFALGQGAVELYAADGTLKRAIGTPTGYPRAAAFDSQGRFLTAWRRGDGFAVRDEVAGKELGFLADKTGSFVEFSADGRRALTAGEGLATVHDLTTGKVVSRFAIGAATVNALGWAGGRVLAWGTGPPGHKAAGPVAAALDLEKLEPAKLDPKEVTRRRLEWGGVTLTDDGYRAKATAGGKAVPLDYDPEFDFGDIKATTLVGPGHAVLFAGEGNGGYDTGTGKEVCRYSHAGWALAPSPDGALFAANSFYDPLVRVFRPGRGEPVLTLYAAGGEWVAWTAGGFWASSPGGAKLAGTLSKAEPGKLRAFVPFPAEKRDPDTVKAAVK